MLKLIERSFSFIFTVLVTFIFGPIFPTSYCHSIKSDVSTTSVASFHFMITVTAGFIDLVLYAIGLYLSIQTINQLRGQQICSDSKIINYQKHFQSIIEQEKQLLQSISQSIELLMRTQIDLHDLIEDIIQHNRKDQMLMQNTVNKLAVLDFIQKDSAITLKKNVNESLQLLKLNSLINQDNKESHQTYINNSAISNCDLSDRVYLFILSFSFLQYIDQIVLWILCYLTSKFPENYYSYSFILSVIILSQSFGLIYFIEITKMFDYFCPLYVCTCIFIIRSFVTIYQYSFSVY